MDLSIQFVHFRCTDGWERDIMHELINKLMHTLVYFLSQNTNGSKLLSYIGAIYTLSTIFFSFFYPIACIRCWKRAKPSKMVISFLNIFSTIVVSFLIIFSWFVSSFVVVSFDWTIREHCDIGFYVSDARTSYWFIMVVTRLYNVYLDLILHSGFCHSFNSIN